MNNLLQKVCSLGAKSEIVAVAPTQLPDVTAVEDGKAATCSGNISKYTVIAKNRVLDRWLDHVVRASGSQVVFFFFLTALATWAFMSIPFHASLTWQVFISDAQAILNYIYDSLLMRQQLNGYEQLQTVAAQLRSRIISHSRMLKKLAIELGNEEMARLMALSEQRTALGFENELPVEHRFGQMVTSFSHGLGHIVIIFIYWVGIVTWLAFGASLKWNDKWQLYMNSATSALMVFVFTFIANIRERHTDYLYKCLDVTFRADSALELKLRLLTGDELSNEAVVIAAPKVKFIQRAIYYYADLVGTLIGIAILISVILVWLAIGPVMSFNTTWWLLIGTYAGLVGFNDGFVLLNVQAKLRDYETVEYAKVDVEETALFETVKMAVPEKKSIKSNSLSHRLSLAVGRFSAHELTVILGVVVIIGLIIGSSLLRWNITGQLLSNVPPSIIETFFMLTLITGHNFADMRTRFDFENIYERRQKLISFVNTVAACKGDEARVAKFNTGLAHV